MFRNSIFDEINRLEKEMDLACGNGQCVALMPKTEEVARLPVSHVYQTESSVIASFELPGVSKEEIELNLIEDRIQVKVERKLEKKAEDEGNYSYEMRKHSFYGALPLPSEVIAENAEASYKDGILRVEIPKAKKRERKKKIEIK